ncbi:MAG: D-glucuronyl C5-epimerase family protein [Micrococcales bacterium]|nr:D-glucuronyl C5-epimerase family protein [Micrococcales bacterium]
MSSAVTAQTSANGSGRAKKRLSVALLVALSLNLVVIGAGGYVLNSKLNRAHHSLLTKIVNDSAGLTSHLAELKANAHPVGPAYSFRSVPEIDPPPYESSGSYLDLTPKAIAPDGFDPNGVALFYRSEISGFGYHPAHAAEYGLKQFDGYGETGDQLFLQAARNQADYFVSAMDPGTGALYYDFEYAIEGHEALKAPWGSAAAQGEAISLLTRIYSVTNEPKYLEAARLAMRPLQVKVEDGGLLQDFLGHPYYEEYPTAVPTYSLSGFMFALVGLLDLSQIADDATAKRLYLEGIGTLRFCLPFYDINGISLYWLSDRSGTLASLGISEQSHLIHITQLQAINQFEHDDLFDYYIDRWISYVDF